MMQCEDVDHAESGWGETRCTAEATATVTTPADPGEDNGVTYHVCKRHYNFYNNIATPTTRG
jgi:hypothetical protein